MSDIQQNQAMEMIMSISTTMEQRTVGNGALSTLAAAAKRLCTAYIAWRLERSAIAVLRSMSDRELSDIGLFRSDFECAVQRSRPSLDPAAGRDL